MRNRLAANICATIWFRKIFSQNIFLKRKCGEGLKSQSVAGQLTLTVGLSDVAIFTARLKSVRRMNDIAPALKQKLINTINQ